jgi:hypothetical protein
VANSQERSVARKLDPLAAVVLHTLVSEGRDGMGITQMAIECQRNPSDPNELGEIERAMEILLGDGLAHREDGLYRPTHAAIRAAELSF